MIYHLCTVPQTTSSFLRQPSALLAILLLSSWLRTLNQVFCFTKKASPLVFTLANIYLASSLGSKIQGSFLDLWKFAGIHDKKWITHFHFPSILYTFFPEPTQTIVEQEVINPSTNWKSSSMKLINTLRSLLCICFEFLTSMVVLSLSF